MKHRDTASGLFWLVIGLGLSIWTLTSYKIGGLTQPGPGYFPLLLGILMTILGALITLKSLTLKTEEGDRVGAWAWKPLFFILAANVAFGVLLVGLPLFNLPATGMIAAIYVLTVIASLAGRKVKLSHSLILATVLAAISYCTFILLLNLQIPVWPAFITG